MSDYVIERVGGPWVLRRVGSVAGPKYQDEVLNAVRSHAFGVASGFAPSRIVVSELAQVLEQWTLSRMDGNWTLDQYTFQRDDRFYACECRGSHGLSGNAQWFISSDGTTLPAFDGEPDDGADLAALEDRIVEWWAANSGGG